MSDSTIEDIISELFIDARNAGGIEYIHTLVRTRDFTTLVVPDPLFELEEATSKVAASEIQSEKEAYCRIASEEAPLYLLMNLLRCTQTRPYRIFPFPLELAPEQAVLRARDWSIIVAEYADELGYVELAVQVRQAYDVSVLNSCASEASASDTSLHDALEHLVAFLSALLPKYRAVRMGFRTGSRFFLIDMGVVECLVDDTQGLCGWRFHRPHMATPFFLRKVDGMDGANYLFSRDTEIQYWQAPHEHPQRPWKIYDKRLYELGIEGRYNPLGDWRPIVYPDSPNEIIQEALSLSDDLDVQGALFYVFATGRKVIEFVVRSTIDLPHDYGTINGVMHLWKCPPLQSAVSIDPNIRIYDGWMQLDSIEPNEIWRALASIGLAVNRLAFAYDARTNWRVKYRLQSHRDVLRTPDEKDVQVFNSLLRDFPAHADAFTLDESIDWYLRGRASTNPFQAFLGYYVAIERIATAVYDGKADFGLGFHRTTKAERRQERDSCIKSLHDSLYPSTPREFVERAYFDCITSITKKTQAVVEHVFGADDELPKRLFDRVEGHLALSQIRSKIAHGSLSLLDREDERMVANRVGEIAQIARAFLGRLIFLPGSETGGLDWSGAFHETIRYDDPRETLVTSTLSALPTSDWRIRPWWCD